MPDCFFSFQPFDAEIEKKLTSRDADSHELFAALSQRLRQAGMGEPDICQIERLFNDFLIPMGAAPEEKRYLSHPIRVTASFLSFFPSGLTSDQVTLGLCHNLKEKNAAAFQSMDDSFVSAAVKANIERLTIDRAREKDPVYLEKFYNRIQEGPEELILLKALDKLDNNFVWPLLDLEDYHAEIVLQQVCPRIAKKYPRLEKYLRELTHYVLEDSVKNKFRKNSGKAA